MAWVQIKPENTGGGRPQREPAAKLYATGQFTLNHAAVALLGEPPRVRVQVEPDMRRIRLQPATPNDNGAFALSGGGNSPYRIRMATAAKKYPQLVGDYRVARATGGIECIWEDDV